VLNNTTLIVISTIVKTFVITITLIVFISQFRSQGKAIREASYQGLMGRYNEFVSSLIEKPELAKFLMDNPADSPAGQDPIVYANILVAFGIIEEAFFSIKEAGSTEIRGCNGQPG
jgi:hypothetical protein